MLAAGGVVLESPAHAGRAYEGELWPNGNAAKDHFRRSEATLEEKSGRFLSKGIPLRGETTRLPPGAVRVDYLLAGQGAKPAVAWAFLDMTPDSRAWLEKRVGPVTECRVEQPLPAKAEAPQAEPPPPAPEPPLPPLPPNLAYSDLEQRIRWSLAHRHHCRPGSEFAAWFHATAVQVGAAASAQAGSVVLEVS